MLKKTTTLTLILLCLKFSIGQDIWVDGYIIDNNADTINGFIDYRGNRINFKSVNFKKEDQGEIHQYKASSIYGYRINEGNYFVSKRINTDNLLDTVFMELLFEGQANIYHYLSDLYYIEVDNILYELKNTQETVHRDGEDFILDKKEYLGILIFLMADANIQSDIEKTSLTSKSLIKIAKKYHETVCPGEESIIYSKEIMPVKMSVGIQGGMIYNKLNFSQLFYSDYSLGYMIGARLSIENVSAWSDRISIIINPSVYINQYYNMKSVDGHGERLDYESIKYIITNGSYNSFIVQPEINVKLKTFVLNIPFAVTYDLTGTQHRPFLGIGITNNIILAQNKDFILYRFYNQFGKSLPTYQLGLSAALGYKINTANDGQIIIESNYEYSSSLYIDQLLRMTTSQLSLIVTYVF